MANLKGMDLQLTNKVAIVTGASTGIGRASALALSGEGARVLGVSRRPPESSVSGIDHFAADLSDEHAPRRVVEHALATYGRLDILVNNAAAARLFEGFLDQSVEDWSALFNLNLLSVVRMMQCALPHLEREGGVIINVTSVNSRMPSIDVPAYSAAKAALLNVGKAIAVEYAARGVRVVTVAPGLTATPMWLGRPEGAASQIAAKSETTPDQVADTVAASIPSKRFLTPEEIGDCVCFLASPRASGVTGSELVIDGALTPTI